MLDEDVVCDVLFVCCDGVWNMPGFETRIPAELEKMEHRPALVVPYHYAEEENPGTGGNGKSCAPFCARRGTSAKNGRIPSSAERPPQASFPV